jgi:Flp pilus assembly protein TadG
MLLLFPAAFMIMLTLAAITVDGAIAFMAQRQLANATEAAANDAASEALSDAAFYRDDRIELSSSAVESLAVDRVFSLVDPARHHGLAVTAQASPPASAGCSWTVRVSASSQVDQLFAKAMPGSSGRVAVKAESTASPRQATGSC